MTIFKPDERTQITDPTQMTFSGYLEFSTLLGTAKRCSAALISPNYILTSGHCVHTGVMIGDSNGEWYSNWRFHPGLTHATQISDKAIPSYQAWTFSEWAMSPNGWNYDLAWITLNVEDEDDDQTISNITPLKLSYDPDLQHGTNFNIVGYPGDKVGTTKWHQFCPMNIIDTEIMYSNECDIAGGASGSPVYIINSQTREREVHCVVSWESTDWNGCARITQEKHDIICSVIGCNNDES